jgi:hypothetical protein
LFHQGRDLNPDAVRHAGDHQGRRVEAEVGILRALVAADHRRGHDEQR